MAFDYDLLVIGAGPGGLAAAKRAASYGVRVAIAEQNSLGGTCVNQGCVPKKLMVYAADFALQDRVAGSYGWRDCPRQLNWSQFTAAMHQHIEGIHQSYLKQLQKAGIELVRGQAAFIDLHTLTVAGRKLTADKVLIAVGGHPLKPSLPGIEHAITSREMFQLRQIPQRLAVIGGGYIGVEFSSIMEALGCQVTLLERGDQILSGFDTDVCNGVQTGLTQRGIEILTETTAKKIEPGPDGLKLSLSGQVESTLTVETVLWATGRTPNTKNLGLEAIGVKVGDKGAIAVNEFSQTTQANVYAVGDCTDRVPLTPVAKMEGSTVADQVFGQQSQKMNYDAVASAVFARPEAASVGLTEAQARDKIGEFVQCYRTQLQPLFDSLSDGNTQNLFKLVVDERSDRVLGAHMVGEHAAEIVQSLAVAVRSGISKQALNATIGIHPTNGEEFISLT